MIRLKGIKKRNKKEIKIHNKYENCVYSQVCNHCHSTITTKDKEVFMHHSKEGVHLSYAEEHVSDSDRIEEKHYNYDAGWTCPVCGFDQNRNI